MKMKNVTEHNKTSSKNYVKKLTFKHEPILSRLRDLANAILLAVGLPSSPPTPKSAVGGEGDSLPE